MKYVFQTGSKTCLSNMKYEIRFSGRGTCQKRQILALYVFSMENYEVWDFFKLTPASFLK
jgi:hypothetical protein